MNLLMICVDDLRPLLGCYGAQDVHTPNFDRLASRGVQFQNAFCQVPVCGASRASLLTGIRPTPQRFRNYLSRADEDAPGASTLIHSLHDAGHRTIGIGKVFHHSEDHQSVWDEYTPRNRSEPLGRYHSDRARRLDEEASLTRRPGDSPAEKRGPSWEIADVPDEHYHDGHAARIAADRLKELATSGESFALCFGSINVHLPFTAPKHYWDLYDPADLVLPVTAEPPTDVTPFAIHNSGEVRNYIDVPDTGVFSEDLVRHLLQGYRAGVSYLDAQVGVLLDALDATGLSESTAIVLWVDHGWNLGEHGMWCKHCLYESSLQVPLIIALPGSSAPSRVVVEQVVENLDLFPTMCELFDMPRPAHLQGKSLVPLMRDPETRIAERAYSRWVKGESVRTERYRFSEWYGDNGEVVGRTLFDLRTDPGEQHDLSADRGLSEVVASLAEELQAVRRKA